MYVARTNDRATFLAQVMNSAQPIYLRTAHVIAPDRNGQHRPGLLLNYSVTDENNGMSWTYEEVAFPTLGGQIDLRGTLYDAVRLGQHPGIRIVASQTSGAL